MAKRDFYETLGVARGASADEIKKAYRQKAKELHPDRNKDDAGAEARFKEISEAYSVLSEPSSRQEYDQVRAMGSGARFTAGGGGAASSARDPGSESGAALAAARSRPTSARS